jgi:hypothetical protein
MSEAAINMAVENYKGVLQQYCQKRALGNPEYETDQQGTSNEPSWIVSVKYGETPYTTPEPIRGSKRFAEHIAAKQILESIESHQEAFLAGDTVDTPSAHEPSTKISSAESLYVPTELVTTALGIANHRLAELRRGTRYRDSIESKQGNQAFAQNLAELTMQLVRTVANAAEASSVEFGDAPRPKCDE